MIKPLYIVAETAIVALMFFLAFAFGLSPLYRTFGWDNATFLYIGKAIAQGGLLPYVEISDNKGILFLMIQAFGQLLSADRWGTAIVFFCTLWGSVYWMYRIALMRLKLVAVRSVLSIVLLIYSISLADGNLTEDYTLLVVLFIYYHLLRHTNWGKRPIRSLRYSLLLGAGIALTALLRLNNCVLLLPWAVYPFFFQTVNPLKWGLGVWAGICVVCLPFVVSFDRGLLMQSWEDTVAYNFQYVESGGGDWSYWNYLSIIFLVLNMFVLFADREIKANKRFLLFMLVVHVLAFAVANMSKRYSHYQTLVLPLIVIGFILWSGKVSQFVGSEKRVRRVFRVVMGVALFAMFILFARKMIYYESIDELSVDLSTTELRATIPVDERDRVALFNLPIHYAYKADLFTTNPYCFSTVQMASASYPSYDATIRRAMMSERTLWVVTSTTPNFTTPIGEVVHLYYEPIKRTEGVIIWRRKGKAVR